MSRPWLWAFRAWKSLPILLALAFVGALCWWIPGAWIGFSILLGVISTLAIYFGVLELLDDAATDEWRKARDSASGVPRP